MDLVLTCDVNDVTIMRADSHASQKMVYSRTLQLSKEGRNVKSEIPESISN